MKQNFKRAKERKKNRLGDFNYSDEEFYFVTICTKNRENVFGTIENGKIILNDFGKITENCWQKIPEHFENVEIDSFVIMPNHIHGIVKIGDPFNPVFRRGRISASPTTDRTKMLLPKIIQQFKSTVTRKINIIPSNFLFQWQRSYHDHVIRNEESLEKIQEYIRINPEQWSEDEFYKL